MKAKSLLIITLLMMFSFSSFAATDAECKARPLLRGNALIEQYVTGPYGGIDIGYYGVYNGCVYVGGINSNSDGSESISWFPQYSFVPGESKPGKKPPSETEKPTETKPNNPDSETVSDGEGTGTGSGAEGAGSGNEEGNHPSEPVSEPNSKPEAGSKPQTDTEPDSFPDITPSPLTPLPSEPSAEALGAQGAYQLLGEYDKCIKQLKGLSDAAYNSAIVQCNSLVDKISGSLTPNKMYSLSDSGDGIPYDFIVKSDFGSVFSCTRNLAPYPELSFSSAYYLNPYYDVEGRLLSKREPIKLTPTGGHYLNMPYYGHDSSFDKFCSSVHTNAVLEYFDNMSQGDTNTSSSDSDAGNNTSSHSGVINDTPSTNSGTMAGNIVSNTGQGNSNTGDGDGILNELKNFHHDFNASQGRAQKTDNKEVVDAINKNGKASVDNSDKNNQALIDTLNKNHQEVIESLNKDNQIDERSLNNAFDDGYSHYENGVTSAIDGIINALDKYSPNLKGFGLPDGFYSGKGHCVPLDLSFNVDLSYFHYSAPVNLSTAKMCEFYDGYPRGLLKLLMYILTAFVLFRLVRKALE